MSVSKSNISSFFRNFVEFSLANMGCNYELKWMEELTANEVYYKKISEIKAALFFYRQKQNEKPRSMLN